MNLHCYKVSSLTALEWKSALLIELAFLCLKWKKNVFLYGWLKFEHEKLISASFWYIMMYHLYNFYIKFNKYYYIFSSQLDNKL